MSRLYRAARATLRDNFPGALYAGGLGMAIPYAAEFAYRLLA